MNPEMYQQLVNCAFTPGTAPDRSPQEVNATATCPDQPRVEHQALKRSHTASLGTPSSISTAPMTQFGSADLPLWTGRFQQQGENTVSGSDQSFWPSWATATASTTGQRDPSLFSSTPAPVPVQPLESFCGWSSPQDRTINTFGGRGEGDMFSHSMITLAAGACGFPTDPTRGAHVPSPDQPAARTRHEARAAFNVQSGPSTNLVAQNRVGQVSKDPSLPAPKKPKLFRPYE